MKKLFYTLIIFMMFLTVTNAAKCNVISGTGKDIGDEIACGTEHFYVVKNDGKNIKMLAKYNLLAGTNYHFVEIDPPLRTKNMNDIYENEKVIEKIKEGYAVSNESSDNFGIYSIDKTTNELIIKGVFFKQSHILPTKTVLFEKTYDNKEEAIKSKESREILNQGYKFESIIENSKNKIIGMKFEKEPGYDYKTIFIDKKERTTYELINIPEVKKYLDNGYRGVISGGTRDEEFFGYNEKSCSTGNPCTYDYYFITVYKNNYYEYKNIFFDKETFDSNNLSSYDDIKKYIESNKDIQELKKEYNVSNYYLEGLSTYSNENRYYGILLSKEKKDTPRKNMYKQDPKAIGAHGKVRGVPEFPEYGGFLGNELYANLVYANKHNEPYGGGQYIDFEINELAGVNIFTSSTSSDILETLYGYERYLNSFEIKTSNITLLSISDIDALTKEVTGKNLPLEKWSEEWKEYKNDRVSGGEIYIIGSLKDILPEKYSWLWGTTYWTRTQQKSESETSPSNLFFVDTWGDMCAASYCEAEVGAGVRPVVTISAEDVKYTIKTKTDGNGTVESTHIEASKDETIKFTIKPNKGYLLKEVKVTDESGNVIVFKENTFTMPEANVIIEATFEVENSDTSTSNITLAIILLTISCLIFYNYKKKIN